MMINRTKYLEIVKQVQDKNTVLVAVSKTKPVEAIRELYELGQRDFGENYVQELVDKQQQLPGDIRWHFIGHLQSNKVKFIAPFIHLIHGIDSLKLLKEVNRQAAKLNRIIPVLLQVHIAREETKFGFDDNDLKQLMEGSELAALTNVDILGMMGMASFTGNEQVIRKEFSELKRSFEEFKDRCQPQAHNCRFSILSMGMSNDYMIAMEAGSTMVRIGSLIFGERERND